MISFSVYFRVHPWFNFSYPVLRQCRILRWLRLYQWSDQKIIGCCVAEIDGRADAQIG